MHEHPRQRASAPEHRRNLAGPDRPGPANASMIYYSIPLFSGLGGLIFLGEPVTWCILPVAGDPRGDFRGTAQVGRVLNGVSILTTAALGRKR